MPPTAVKRFIFLVFGKGYPDIIWFMLDSPDILLLPAGSGVTDLFESPFLRRLEELLPDFLCRARWFGGKARAIRSARFSHTLPLPGDPRRGRFGIVAVTYRDGGNEEYLVPLTLDRGRKSEEIQVSPQAILAELQIDGEPGLVYDSAYDPNFRESLFRLIPPGTTVAEGEEGIRGVPGQIISPGTEPGESRVLAKEQSNTSFLYGDRYILKLYRRPEEGVNPEIEMTRFLTEKAGFKRTPPFAGTLEMILPGRQTISAAVLQGIVPHQDDGWNYTRDEVSHCLYDPSPEARAKARESYSGFAQLLGRRTAQLHRALASVSEELAFVPEPESTSDLQDRRRSIEDLLDHSLATLNNLIDDLPAKTAEAGREILARRQDLRTRITGGDLSRGSGWKIRIHGDYHLGQLLWDGDDVTIIDFEGEPARPLAFRRRKRSPLVDVAGMIRSFHYASRAGIFLSPQSERENPDELSSRADAWYWSASDAFLDSYRETMAAGPPLLPTSREEESRLLDLFLIKKAAYELDYELNNRPDWAIIPLCGLSRLARTTNGTG